MPSRFVNEINKPNVTTAPAIDPNSDGALVLAAKSGDELAFEILVKRYQSRIFALAFRYTRVREDAEDIVQQTFQKAFVYLHGFQGKSSFATWLTRIAINEALMFLRRTRALREVSIDDSSNDELTAPRMEIADASPDPEATYLLREGERVLSGAIGKLAPGMRSALELRELRELSSRETACYMGLSVSAVKARVFHGRRKLREALRIHMRSYRKPTTGSEANISQDHLCNACR